MILYVTYKESGRLKRATLSQEQYSNLSKNHSISELTIHPSPNLMENAYNQATGKSINTKQVLFG